MRTAGSSGFDRAAWARSVRAPAESPDLLNCRARSSDSLPERVAAKRRHVSTIAENAFMLSPPALAGIKTSPSQFTSPRRLGWILQDPITQHNCVHPYSEKIYHLIGTFSRECTYCRGISLAM